MHVLCKDTYQHFKPLFLSAKAKINLKSELSCSSGDELNMMLSVYNIGEKKWSFLTHIYITVFKKTDFQQHVLLREKEKNNSEHASITCNNPADIFRLNEGTILN